MIKVDHIDVFNFENAIRGCRNPMNSWGKSDSYWNNNFVIGENDLVLMNKLFKSGTEHRKFMRQIFVSMDITAPLYWWKEFDTYKIGTTADSCSTMHKITAKEFALDDFSHEHIKSQYLTEMFNDLIRVLNFYRAKYLINKDKSDWWQIIQLLPTSYNQMRTVTMNYEVVTNIIRQRKNHKLDEWREFCKILEELPHYKEITDGIEKV